MTEKQEKLLTEKFIRPWVKKILMEEAPMGIGRTPTIKKIDGIFRQSISRKHRNNALNSLMKSFNGHMIGKSGGLKSDILKMTLNRYNVQ